MKKCRVCKKSKSSASFNKKPDNSGGLNTMCKKCQSEYSKSITKKNSKRKEIKISINEVFTEEDVRIVKDACGWMCILCGSHDNLSVDHFKPLSKMNPLRIGNAIILCTSCNSKKHNKDPKEFFDDKMYQIALSCIAISDILKNGVG